MIDPELRVLPTPEFLADAAARCFARLAWRSIRDRGGFDVCLAGGSTPRAMYARLAAEPWRDRIDWPRVRFFFGDERCVPPDHPDSNYRMACETLLEHLPHNPDRVFRMEGEREPTAAATHYEERLRNAFDAPLPRFDLALLGLGTDGHTASLFPGTEALDVRDRACVANRVESLNTWRLTLTYPALNAASQVLFVVAGATKFAALRGVLRDHDASLPAQRVRPHDGHLMFIADEAAVRGAK